MILISINVEYNNNLIKDIRRNGYNKKINIFVSDDLNYNNNYSKYDYVITEYNTKKIDYFYTLGKKIIICNFENKAIDSSYRKKENIFVCNSKTEVINLLSSRPVKRKNKAVNFLKMAVPVCLGLFIVVASIWGLSKINFTSNNKEKDNKKQVESTINRKEDKDSNELEETNSTQAIDFGKENYLFLGDSITEFYDLEKYYDGIPVVNSGKSGDHYPNLLDHLDKRVFVYNPTKVFLLIGTNDIAFTKITNEELVDKIIEICDEIHKNKKKTKIYVESLYPVNKNDDNDIVDLKMVGNRENERIKEINILLEEKVKESNYKYIDMYTKLEDENGNLKLEYTIDGLHISDEGYEIITEVIKDIIYNA